MEDRIILEQKPYSKNPKDSHLEVVLCKLPQNTVTPYVTWIHNKERGDFFSGEYCFGLDQALISYKERGV